MSIDKLVHWAKANGAVIDPHVSFENGTHGISARYNSDTKSGETSTWSSSDPTIGIPYNVAVTPKFATESLGLYGEELHAKSSNINSVLKMFLCLERTSGKIKSSFYEPYLALLPDLFEINSPYSWSASEKVLLKGTNLGNSLKENTSQLVEEWWQAVNLIPESAKASLNLPEEHFVNLKFYYEYKFYTDEDFHGYLKTSAAAQIDNWTSFPNYLWASLILKSRSFPYYLLKGEGENVKQDEAMLLPLIDLLNHNMRAKVDWSTSVADGVSYFDFRSESIVKDSELFNNYGMKGNEELLLAYGFCLEDNVADSAALKIKVPLELLPDLESQGIKLPEINDYTTSVLRIQEDIENVHFEKGSENTNKPDYKRFEDGLLFFVTKDNLPENLVKLFQCLVRNSWEISAKPEITLRMQLAGLNQLRQAIESKSEILNQIKLPSANTSTNISNIHTYIKSQRGIFSSTIKKIKHLEKHLLSDQDNKSKLLSLKTVYKKDVKFQQALLVSLGITSYDDIIDSEFQDQFWLLYLIRCYNKEEYVNEDPEESNFLPDWIHELFVKLSGDVKIAPQDIVQFKELYLGLIPNLAEAVPEVFGKGKWRVNELIVSAKLLDLISFVRGKEQECILVQCEYR